MPKDAAKIAAAVTTHQQQVAATRVTSAQVADAERGKESSAFTTKQADGSVRYDPTKP